MPRHVTKFFYSVQSLLHNNNNVNKTRPKSKRKTLVYCYKRKLFFLFRYMMAVGTENLRFFEIIVMTYVLEKKNMKKGYSVYMFAIVNMVRHREKGFKGIQF